MSIKTYCLLLFSICLLNALHAQKDTIYHDALYQTVENREIASYYTVISKRQNLETHTDYYLSGIKHSYYMNKKLPQVYKNELVVVGFTPQKSKPKPNALSKDATQPKDSVMVKHGTFMEWYDSGELKVQGSYFAGQLHGELTSFYKNQKPKRQDVYHLDTLKSGHCFDSLGIEITHFPYYIPPEYKDGQMALFQFLGKNVIYPKDARESGKQGTAYISFVVDKEGKIRKVNADVKLNQNMDKELVEEAVRVVKVLPPWKPAMIDGENVSVRYTLPIKFKME